VFGFEFFLYVPRYWLFLEKKGQTLNCRCLRKAVYSGRLAVKGFRGLPSSVFFGGRKSLVFTYLLIAKRQLKWVAGFYQPTG